MKEMVYNAFEYSCEVLYSGEYKAHKFAILNLGSHPAAYIENKIGVSYESDFRLENINVHCGFTFCETGYWGEESEKISWLGWDYGHYGDFMGYYLQNHSQHQWEKQWTTAEIYEEVKTVIDQIIVVENFDKKGQYKDIINMIKDLDIDYFSNSDKQQICKTLYQKGYRKQSDTVREFTNKINLIECKMFHEAHDIRSSCIEILDYTKPQDERVWGQKMECDGKMFALQKLMTEIKHIAAEYGVEVEE